MGFSRQGYWSGLPRPPPGDLPSPGIATRSPALPTDSLPAEPQGKPKNTGVGSLSLLQGIFPTQESNQGLLHCRRILYQGSYQGTRQMLIAMKGETDNNTVIAGDFNTPLTPGDRTFKQEINKGS